MRSLQSQATTLVQLAQNSYNDIMALLQKAETVLAERNRLCKLNK